MDELMSLYEQGEITWEAVAELSNGKAEAPEWFNIDQSGEVPNELQQPCD